MAPWRWGRTANPGKDIEKCIECGLCYSICPEISELDEETKRQAAWSAPMGRILGTTVSRARDPEVRAKATDGGVVTALLLHLFDLGRIDGAVVTRQVGPFQRQPWLATNREEILEAAASTSIPPMVQACSPRPTPPFPRPSWSWRTWPGSASAGWPSWGPPARSTL
jgi:coenzyme F420-reducing hydrogenase beta subunit